MKIAVLSGKGGAGKTFVATNLASVIGKSTYLDCDVEEPNGHLFFEPEWINDTNVEVKIPRVDFDKCIGCRTCVDFCKFNALAFILDKVKVFDDICHSCGGCELFCESNAIYEINQTIGKISKGKYLDKTIYSGQLKIGQSSGVPIIEKQLQLAKEDKDVIIDCPPGSACIVMESIKEADYCLLVAEPTVFGVHNLQMVYELTQVFKKPCGIVINKSDDSQTLVEDYALSEGIKILKKFDFDERLGLLISNGKLATAYLDTMKKEFTDLYFKVRKEFEHETTTRS